MTSAVYNGTYIPPVLRLRPGDTLYPRPRQSHHRADQPALPRIQRLAAHQCRRNGVGQHLRAGRSGREAQLPRGDPRNHNPGLYWYHTHRHELAERQVMGGLSGGLVIDGILDPFPQLRALPSASCCSRTSRSRHKARSPTISTRARPSCARSTDTAIRRCHQAGRNAVPAHRQHRRRYYYHLKLDGHKFYELARDGNRRNQLIESTSCCSLRRRGPKC